MPDIAFATRTTTVPKPAAKLTLQTALKQATAADLAQRDARARLDAFNPFREAATQP